MPLSLSDLPDDTLGHIFVFTCPSPALLTALDRAKTVRGGVHSYIASALKAGEIINAGTGDALPFSDATEATLQAWAEGLVEHRAHAKLSDDEAARRGERLFSMADRSNHPKILQDLLDRRFNPTARGLQVEHNLLLFVAHLLKTAGLEMRDDGEALPTSMTAKEALELWSNHRARYVLPQHRG